MGEGARMRKEKWMNTPHNTRSQYLANYFPKPVVLNETEKNKIVAEWFADTWLLVAENDFEMWSQLVEDSKGKTVAEFSDHLREEYENVAEETIEFVENKNKFGWFLREFLQGWGSTPFDIIASRILETVKENA